MSPAVGAITKKICMVKALSSPQSAFFRAPFLFSFFKLAGLF